MHVSRGFHEEQEEHRVEHIHEVHNRVRVEEEEGEEREHHDRKKDHRDEEHVQDRGGADLLSEVAGDFGEKQRGGFKHMSSALVECRVELK